ncbi:hypothetical protein [Pararhizobium sp.]|uniref:S-methyl thiohydantoin desulfurase domain-containing protein n=1 Tax=Pararhizobium sp. TaxID=1977563 RepID=UPI003D0DFC4E
MDRLIEARWQDHLCGAGFNPQWWTPAGISLVGPRYFGYDADYQQYPFAAAAT